MINKRTISVLISLCIILSGVSVYASPEYIVYTAGNSLNNCMLDDTVKYEGAETAKWNAAGTSGQVIISYNEDVSECTHINFDIYSPAETSDTIGIHIKDKNAQKAIIKSVKIDWEGWKTLSIALSDYQGLDKTCIESIELWHYGWSYTYGTNEYSLNIGKIWFDKQEEIIPNPTETPSQTPEPENDDREYTIVAFPESYKWDVSKNSNLSYPILCNTDEYSYINMLIKTPNASNSIIMYRFSVGDSYVTYNISLDFEGMKLIEVPISDISIINPEKVELWNYGWNNVIEGIDTLEIERIWLSKYQVSKPQIIESNIEDGYDRYDAFEFAPWFEFSSTILEDDDTKVYITDKNGSMHDVIYDIENNILTCAPAEGIEPGNSYTLNLVGIRGNYGKADNVKIDFKTKEKGLSAQTKLEKTEDGYKVIANISNSGQEDAEAVVYAIEYNINNQIVSHTEQRNILKAESNISIVKDIVPVDTQDKLAVFVTDGEGAPVSESIQGINTVSEVERSSVMGDDVINNINCEINIDEISFEGEYASPFTRLFVVSIYSIEVSEDGVEDLVYILPVMSKTDGKLTDSVILDETAFLSGTYRILLQGINGTVFNKTFIYVDSKQRDEIVSLINNSTYEQLLELDKEMMKKLGIKTEDIESFVNNAGNRQHIAEVLYNNADFEDYQTMVKSLNNAIELRDNINSSAWNNIPQILLDNAQTLGLDEEDYNYFNSLTGDEQGKIAQSIKKMGEKATFSGISESFSKAIDEYRESEKDTDKPQTGGGGGGSSGGNSSVGTGSYVIAPVQAAETDDNYFVDLGGYEWAKESINMLIKQEVIAKPDDKLFRPGDMVKREEYAKMLVCAFGMYDVSSECSFDDVAADDWYYKYVSSLVKVGVISGYGESFGSGDSITREDMFVMCYRLLDLLGKLEDVTPKLSYSDNDKISEYAKAAIGYFSAIGVVSGMEDGRVYPQKNATRAEAAKILASLMET